MNAALKRAVLASAVGFAVAFAASCGGNNNNNNNPPTCDATSCPTGCCDSTGTCQLGTSASACGKGGGQCLTCLNTQTCSNQVCTAGTGGGAGGGSGGGSGGGAGGGGGGSSGTLTGDAGVDALNATCASGKTAYCAYLARCGWGSTLAGICEEGIDRGDTITVSPCGDLQLLVAIQQGRTGIDTGALSSCVAALSTAPCDHTVLSDPRGPFATVCKDAIVPKSTVGGACTMDGPYECPASSYCDTESGTTCPSTCRAGGALGADAGEDDFINRCATGLYPYDDDDDGVYLCDKPVDAGASCAPGPLGFSNKQCAAGSFCDVGGNETCVPLGGADAGCFYDEDCAADHVCVDDPQTLDSVCRKSLIGTGTACSGSGSFSCKIGLSCDFNTDKCIAPKAVGGTCDTSNQDFDCRLAGYCDDVADGGQECVTKKTSGLCPGGGECAAGYFCDFNTGTCKARGGIDAGCDAEDLECEPGLACGAADRCVLPYSCP